jgi:hypothetical protein
MTVSQILVIIGLVFQFFSFAVSVRTVFSDIKYYIDVRFRHKSKYKVNNVIKPKDIVIALVLLIAGMILQGLSVFV